MLSLAPRRNDDSSKRTVAAAAICAALLIVFGLTARTALTGKGATMDEPTHFCAAWIQTHYDDFSCDPENPPLWKYYVAVETDPHLLNIDHGPTWQSRLKSVGPTPIFIDALYHTKGTDPDVVLDASRSRMVLLGMILGIVIAWWAWRLAGPVAAVIATTAFCLDPNFLAHSGLVKNDVPITLIFVAFMMSVWLLGQRATLWRWLGVSLLLGAALTTKFSGILAIPMLGLAMLCRTFIASPWPVLNCTARTTAQRLAAALPLGFGSLLVAYVFIWACYGFRFSISTDPYQSSDWQAANVACAINQATAEHHVTVPVPDSQMQQWIQQWHPDAMIRLVHWTADHRLLPEAWLIGFQIIYGASQSSDAFLCGKVSATGWWYYFPLAMLFKTPLATLLGLALAVIVWLRWQRQRPLDQWDWWTLAAGAIAPTLYMAAALPTSLNHGLRHVFPVYPFLFIFLGVVAAHAWRRRPKLTAVVASILALGLAIETYTAYPDFIPFFNVVAANLPGGKLELLSDSNIDWGQDLPLVGQWQKQHPDRTVCLFYFGAADPRYYGIKYYFSSSGYDSKLPDRREKANKNVVIAVSATELQYCRRPMPRTNDSDPNRTFWAPYRDSKPLDVLGGSIYLYDLR